MMQVLKWVGRSDITVHGFRSTFRELVRRVDQLSV